MSRGLQIFRQTDVAKAIKAAQNAGLDVQRFEIGALKQRRRRLPMRDRLRQRHRLVELGLKAKGI
jgi:hypothetical protein